MPGIHQTENFLEKKENRAWNSKQIIGILVERNEIITIAYLFSFASRSYWPINEGKNIYNQRIALQRGRETWRKERTETETERSMGRGETRISDSEGVRREKVKGREKKWENLPWEREGAKKLCFPRL